MSVVDVARTSQDGAGPSSAKLAPTSATGTWKTEAETLDTYSVLPELNGGDTEQPALRRYAHSFFDPELSQKRRAYLTPVVRATLLTILLTWACLPIYWGSLSASAELTGNLVTWVVNRDEGRFGESFVAAVHEAATSGPGSLGWQIMSETRITSDEEVIQAVLNETIWMGVIVSTNVSDQLGQARLVGNTSYDPTSAISVVYAQARNDVATGTFLIPAVTSFLTNFTTTYATGSVQRYLATIVMANGTVNETALHMIAQAPQTMSPGVSFNIVNLRPYAPPVSQAVLLVGQIYVCIFTFIFVMAHDSARAIVAPHLTFFSYFGLRIITPLLAYLPLSISIALVSLPFKIPFGGHFGFGSGFMTFCAFVYLGMAALGLALEAMITVLSRKFVPFFLVLLIVVNISTAALPPELQPKIYAYGAGFPFWNIQQADRTLFFNTYSHLPKNAGVLVAWVLLSTGTLALFTWLRRFFEVRRVRGLPRRPVFSATSSSRLTRVQKASGKEVVKSDGVSVKARSQEKAKVDEKERGYRNSGEGVGAVSVCEV